MFLSDWIQSLIDGIGAVPVKGNTRKRVSASILLPVGSAHNAGDVIANADGDVLEFDCSTFIQAGGSGKVESTLLTLDQNALFTGEGGYVLHLFDAPPVVQADGEAFNITATDLPHYIGNVAIESLTVYGDSCMSWNYWREFDFTLADGVQKLYGKLVCVTGVTTVTDSTIGVHLGIINL